MFALSLPTQILNRISRFWVIFFGVTALLWWLVSNDVIGGYIAVMWFLMIAPLAILLREVFVNNDARIWLHFVMLIPYVVVLVMLYFGMAGREDELIDLVPRFLSALS